MKTKLLLFALPLALLIAGGIQAQPNGSGAPERSVASLAEVRTIYIKAMPGQFDQYLAGEILRRLPRGVTLTLNEDSADAVLRGAGQDSAHGISPTVNQIFGVGGSAAAAVELVTPSGQILWAAEKSDHTIPLYGTWREHGKSKVAGRIAKNLADALRTEKRAKRRANRGIY